MSDVRRCTTCVVKPAPYYFATGGVEEWLCEDCWNDWIGSFDEAMRSWLVSFLRDMPTQH